MFVRSVLGGLVWLLDRRSWVDPNVICVRKKKKRSNVVLDWDSIEFRTV